MKNNSIFTIAPLEVAPQLPHSKRLHNKCGGFSLVELMFAMVLLTIVVFGVLKLQTSNLTVSNTNKNEIQAHFYANQGMEIVKALGKAELCTPPEDSFCIRYISYGTEYGFNTTDTDPITEPFIRTIKIEDIGLTDGYKVSSIIEWIDSTGKHNLTDGGAVISSRIIF